MTPQARTIFAHLKRAGSISNVEAHAVHRCRSVSRRITEITQSLKGSGYAIEKKSMKDVTGQRYTRYFLVKEVA